MTEPPPPSRREQMKDAVSQLLTNIKEERKAASAEALAALALQKRHHRLLIGLTVVMALAFVASVILMLPRWRHPFPTPVGAEAEAHAERAAAFAASMVERFRTDRGRLPISLDETGVKLPGVRYVVLGEGYEITIDVEGRPVTHRGGPPDARDRPGER